MSNARLFYVYTLARSSTGEIVYVGKGYGDRCLWHNRIGAQHTNPILRGIYVKDGPFIVSRVLETTDEQAAFIRERFLIGLYGRRDQNKGMLANMTDGGEGVSGLVHSAETRAKLSACVKTPEHRSRLSSSLKGRGPPAAHMERLAQINRGNKNTAGKSLSDEHRNKISASSKGRKQSALQAARIREAWTGREHSEETRLKMSLSAQARPPQSAEKRARIADSVRKSWETRRLAAGKV